MIAIKLDCLNASHESVDHRRWLFEPRAGKSFCFESATLKWSFEAAEQRDMAESYCLQEYRHA
jgi:hypothetical protein